MSAHPLRLHAEDHAAYETWRRNLIMFWGFVVAVVAVAGTILALDSTLTTEQRIEMALDSGTFP
jgi:hypothetical protein